MAQRKSKEDIDASEREERTEVTVTWNGGSRVYSKEIHGADFEKLAKQFADKFKGDLA